MRKTITFTINDKRWYEDRYHLASQIFDPPFAVEYTISGEDGSMHDKYSLVDSDGNRLNINDLNGYERSMLWKCDKYFVGKTKAEDLEGVILISEGRE